MSSAAAVFYHSPIVHSHQGPAIGDAGHVASGGAANDGAFLFVVAHQPAHILFSGSGAVGLALADGASIPSHQPADC